MLNLWGSDLLIELGRGWRLDLAVAGQRGLPRSRIFWLETICDDCSGHEIGQSCWAPLQYGGAHALGGSLPLWYKAEDVPKRGERARSR